MLSYVARRLALGLFTLWAISVLTFAIIQLPPGDFASTLLARVADSGTASSAESLAKMRADFGLDQPLYVQYFQWVAQMLHGNLGMSFDQNKLPGELCADHRQAG